MKSGIVFLEQLYEWVKGNHRLYGDEDTEEARKPFYALCREVTKAVPERQGFYLWGQYDKEGRWKNIYLGKAGYGKIACLKSRIEEELRDEKAFAWRIRMTNEEIIEAGKLKSPQRTTTRGRSLKKEGTTHIVWVSVPGLSEEAVARIEADLIESLNPSANHMRPVPKAVFQGKTKDVFKTLRETIHRHRELRGSAIKLATEPEPAFDVRKAHA